MRSFLAAVLAEDEKLLLRFHNTINKLDFIEDMIARSERKDSDWSRNYGVGKWAVRYLEMLQEKKASDEQIKEVCKRYWRNSAVRRYYDRITLVGGDSGSGKTVL